MGGRVLVTEGEERAVLAVARGLASAGYTVGATASRRPAAAHWSRFVSQRYRLPDPRRQPIDYVRGLIEIARAGRYDAVVPGTEAALAAVSEHRDEFPPTTKLGLPPRSVVLRVLEKGALYAAAAAAGLAAPEAIRCAGPEEAGRAAERIGYPVVVKPDRSFATDGSTPPGLPPRVATSPAEVDAACAAVAAPVVVQRQVCGNVVAYAGVRAEGRLLALSAARYERTWPPGLGAGSLNVSIEPDPDVLGRVERILELLEWQGIFQLQMLEEPGSPPAPIDFNPRPYGSLCHAIAAGANLPAIWCAWLLGEGAPAETVVSQPGWAYRWEDGELGNLTRALRERRLADVRAIARPLPRTVYAFARRDDPGPAAAHAVAVARGRASRDRA